MMESPAIMDLEKDEESSSQCQCENEEIVGSYYKWLSQNTTRHHPYRTVRLSRESDSYQVGSTSDTKSIHSTAERLNRLFTTGMSQDGTEDNTSFVILGVKPGEISASTGADVANRSSSSSRPGNRNRCHGQQPQKDCGGRTRARAASPLSHPSTSDVLRSSSSRHLTGKRDRFSTPLRSPDLHIQAEETRRKSQTGNVPKNIERPTLHTSRTTSVLGTETREEEILEKRKPLQVQFQVPNESASMGNLIKDVTSCLGNHIYGRYRKNFKGQKHQQRFSDALNRAVLGIRPNCSSFREILALFAAIDPVHFNAEIERTWRKLIEKDAKKLKQSSFVNGSRLN